MSELDFRYNRDAPGHTFGDGTIVDQEIYNVLRGLFGHLDQNCSHTALRHLFAYLMRNGLSFPDGCYHIQELQNAGVPAKTQRLIAAKLRDNNPIENDSSIFGAGYQDPGVYVAETRTSDPIPESDEVNQLPENTYDSSLESNNSNEDSDSFRSITTNSAADMPLVSSGAAGTISVTINGNNPGSFENDIRSELIDTYEKFIIDYFEKFINILDDIENLPLLLSVDELNELPDKNFIHTLLIELKAAIEGSNDVSRKINLFSRLNDVSH